MYQPQFCHPTEEQPQQGGVHRDKSIPAPPADPWQGPFTSAVLCFCHKILAAWLLHDMEMWTLPNQRKGISEVDEAVPFYFFFFFKWNVWGPEEFGFVLSPFAEGVHRAPRQSLLWYFRFVRAHPLAPILWGLWSASCALFRVEYSPVELNYYYYC